MAPPPLDHRLDSEGLPPERRPLDSEGLLPERRLGSEVPPSVPMGAMDSLSMAGHLPELRAARQATADLPAASNPTALRQA